MIELVTWRSSLEEARIEAREVHKDLLVDLFNPGDTAAGIWCNTYPDPRVSRFINEHTVPCSSMSKRYRRTGRYHAQWTPALFYQDVEGNEFRRRSGRSTGPIPGRVLACLAHRFFHSGQFDKSVEMFEQALDYTRFDPTLHAENLYWIGPAKYEGSGSVDDLMAGWKKLQQRYPDSEWRRRACSSNLIRD